MNKQEALEAILRKVRGWEEPKAEMRRVDPSTVYEEAVTAAKMMDSLPGEELAERGEELLVTMAAGALYLLVDEVAVVEGRTLDEWLASEEDGKLAMFARGETRVVVERAP